MAAKVNIVPPEGQTDSALLAQVKAFGEKFEPLEANRLVVVTDARTGAHFCECHIKASVLIKGGTVDVPLDPDEQPEYRANRDLVLDHAAYERMVADAISRRTFSNIVTEYVTTYDAAHPLKVIGGQHRFSAINVALAKKVDEYHGVKVYFNLDTDQRMDVQLISNTNIAVSTDLFDRMQETVAGPALRNWCQAVGLLDKGQDFAARRERGGVLTVRAVRTFIVNYYRGRAVDAKSFDKTNTTPNLSKSGEVDVEWEALKTAHQNWNTDAQLKKAGEEFALLTAAQRAHFAAKNPNVDFAEKVANFAVLSSWAFVAGALHDNKVRLQRHFDLRKQVGKDPLNAAALAKGKHKTDPENYRGLGYRTDAKERARFVELFYLQAEKGGGINPGLVDLGIKKYHAKLAQLEVVQAGG